MVPRYGFFLPALLLVILGCGGPPSAPQDPLDDDDDVGMVPAEEGSLSTTNSVGRSGAYYIPAHQSGTALPVLLVYHYTGGAGLDMVNVFRPLAEARTFAIVAPDSRVSPDGQFTWEVGNQAGEVTPDVTHALACLDELTDSLGVTLDPSFLLAAGHSGGASSAPYVASNNDDFTGFAILHGGVVAGGIGDHIVRGWLSTGEDDDIRPPDGLEDAADYLQGLGFDDLTVSLYPGGHGIDSTEAADLIDWWLAP